MDPDRKRRYRLIVALTAVVLLATAGLYVTYSAFSGSTEAKEPSQVIADGANGQSAQVTGKVVSYKRDGADLSFVLEDRDGGAKTLPVEYTGIVPDPFREGREVIVTGTLDDEGVLMAQKDSLITKCPSKFSDEVDDTNVQFVN
ncbi:MAG: cytochrome c maturation protein CcmE [Acidobacteria bacterium]|nr:cytochrome c maturation protein CcmE [Acidobacteriota bacterium]